MSKQWWQNAVIYQIYPRSYKDANNDGIGDLVGITQQLDYLSWLGVDAIWFSPLYPSPWKDGGYDVADYTDINPQIGTLTDFDNLLAAADERGIRVILDLVPNHTSDQHPWFQESRTNRDNPRADWYIWKDAKPDGSPPNNWQAFFGDEGAWQWDATRKQYYLHSFLPEQPDLNWRNPNVRTAIYDAIRFWLDRGVAGFRVDVIDFMMKDEQFRDEPPNPAYDPAVNIPRDQTLHIYSAYQDEVHEVIREMRAVFEEYDDRVFIGELTYEITLDKYLSYYGTDDELMLPFNFKPLEMTMWGKNPTAAAMKAYIDTYEQAVGDRPANWVFGNHDVVRVATRVGQRARVYTMLLLTLRGTAFLYQGDEIGMENVDVPPAQMKDPFGINVPGQGRDGCRTPMQWDATANAGFSDAGVETWLPLSPDYQTVNVDAQSKDETAFLLLTRRLIDLRREKPALRQGRYTPMQNVPSEIVGYFRQHTGQQLAVLLNFSDQEQDMMLAPVGEGRVLISTLLDRNNTVPLKQIVLRPYEGVVVQLPTDTSGLLPLD